MGFRYLHPVGKATFWLDHRLTAEVRGMLCAMASRAPKGGVEARYEQIVEAVAEDLLERWGWPDLATVKADRTAHPDGPAAGMMTRYEWACHEAEDRLCEYPLHPKVQRFFDDFVGKYGHSSILELTGQPPVYSQMISWVTAWQLFDSPLCAGQEFSTRAVQHRDWPMARECYETDINSPEWLQHLAHPAPSILDVKHTEGFRDPREDLPPIPWRPNAELAALHRDWFEVFEAEVAAWKSEFTSACPACGGSGSAVVDTVSRPDDSAPALSTKVRCASCEGTGKKYPTHDKEPFRPALDRARWALPGTIAVGCAHTSGLRERSRVIRDGSLLAQAGGNLAAVEVWKELAQAYREALPGLSGMGLREAVYGAESKIPGHLRGMLSSTDDGPDVEVATAWTGGLNDLSVFRRAGEKAYVDPAANTLFRVDVGFRCSLAVARDWHRHRTMYPWYLQVVRDVVAGSIFGTHVVSTGESTSHFVEGGIGPIKIDHHYAPMSDLAKAKVPGLLRRSTDFFDEAMSRGDVNTAALALPLGTRVRLRGQGGVRDAVYVLELRKYAHGANFEYQDQATRGLDLLRADLGDALLILSAEPTSEGAHLSADDLGPDGPAATVVDVFGL